MVPKWSAVWTPARRPTHLTCPCSTSVHEPATSPEPTRQSSTAAPLQRIFDPRGDRPPNELIHLHHRRHPGSGHVRRQARARRVQIAPSCGKTAPGVITPDALQKSASCPAHIHKRGTGRVSAPGNAYVNEAVETDIRSWPRANPLRLVNRPATPSKGSGAYRISSRCPGRSRDISRSS